jgi:hypothetical protein
MPLAAIDRDVEVDLRPTPTDLASPTRAKISRPGRFWLDALLCAFLAVISVFEFKGLIHSPSFGPEYALFFFFNRHQSFSTLASRFLEFRGVWYRPTQFFLPFWMGDHFLNWHNLAAWRYYELGTVLAVCFLVYALVLQLLPGRRTAAFFAALYFTCVPTIYSPLHELFAFDFFTHCRCPDLRNRVRCRLSFDGRETMGTDVRVMGRVSHRPHLQRDYGCDSRVPRGRIGDPADLRAVARGRAPFAWEDNRGDPVSAFLGTTAGLLAYSCALDSKGTNVDPSLPFGRELARDSGKHREVPLMACAYLWTDTGWHATGDWLHEPAQRRDWISAADFVGRGLDSTLA